MQNKVQSNTKGEYTLIIRDLDNPDFLIRNITNREAQRLCAYFKKTFKELSKDWKYLLIENGIQKTI